MELSQEKYETVIQATNDAVREHLARAFVRSPKEKPEEFRDLVNRFMLLLVEQTPDNWFHEHEKAKFIASVNEDRNFFLFLVGIDNHLRASLLSRGLTLKALQSTCYVGLGRVEGVTDENTGIVDAELMEKWPESVSTMKFIEKNPLLLTLLLLHAHCSVTEVLNYVTELSSPPRKSDRGA